MLSNNLNTNEVKNAAAVEVEFQHLRYPTSDSREFALIGEAYDMPHRLRVSHRLSGTGLKQKRNSAVSFLKTVAGSDGSPVTVKCNVTVEIPVGNLGSNDEVENICAEAGSFCFTAGDTTFVHACTTPGVKALIDGSL